MMDWPDATRIRSLTTQLSMSMAASTRTRLRTSGALLKRGIHGTYVSVEPFHLHRYLDEQTLRYNLRKLNDAGRFQIVLRQIVDKRLTYDELTGKAAMEKQRREFSQEVETWEANN